MKIKCAFKIPFEVEQWFPGLENPDVKGENCHCSNKCPYIHDNSDGYPIKLDPGDWLIYHHGEFLSVYNNKSYQEYFRKIEQ